MCDPGSSSSKQLLDELVLNCFDGPPTLALGSDESPKMDVARPREAEPVAFSTHATTGFGDRLPLVVESASGYQDSLVVTWSTRRHSFECDGVADLLCTNCVANRRCRIVSFRAPCLVAQSHKCVAPGRAAHFVAQSHKDDCGSRWVRLGCRAGMSCRSVPAGSCSILPARGEGGPARGEGGPAFRTRMYCSDRLGSAPGPFQLTQAPLRDSAQEHTRVVPAESHRVR